MGSPAELHTLSAVTNKSAALTSWLHTMLADSHTGDSKGRGVVGSSLAPLDQGRGSSASAESVAHLMVAVTVVMEDTLDDLLLQPVFTGLLDIALLATNVRCEGIGRGVRVCVGGSSLCSRGVKEGGRGAKAKVRVRVPIDSCGLRPPPRGLPVCFCLRGSRCLGACTFFLAASFKPLPLPVGTACSMTPCAAPLARPTRPSSTVSPWRAWSSSCMRYRHAGTHPKTPNPDTLNLNP